MSLPTNNLNDTLNIHLFDFVHLIQENYHCNTERGITALSKEVNISTEIQQHWNDFTPHNCKT